MEFREISRNSYKKKKLDFREKSLNFEETKSEFQERS